MSRPIGGRTHERNLIQEIAMEPAKLEEAQDTSKIIEMGRVSEETKGTDEPGFESLMHPTTQEQV
jgi:hypothetical protein